jgi:hypothetical protein
LINHHAIIGSGYDDHTIQPESKATFECGAEYNFKFSVPDRAKFPTPTATKEPFKTGTPAPGVPAPGVLGPQKCYDTDKFGKHGDVRGKEQMEGSLPCLSKEGTIAKGSDPIEWVNKMGSTYYHYKIAWIDTCDGPTQDIVKPLGGDEANNNGAWCHFMLQKNWEACKSWLRPIEPF